MPFNVLLLKISRVEHARAWSALSEAAGHRKVEFCRHDIAKIMKRKGAFVRDNGLNLSFPISAPKRPPDEILMRITGIIAEPEQAMVYRQPIPALPVKVLLAICVTDRKSLNRCEIPTLL